MKLTLIFLLFSTNGFANEYFIELSQGVSDGKSSAKSVSVDWGYEEYSSFEVATTVFDARFGYSFYIKNNFFLEPSIGIGYLKSFYQDIKIDELYSIEVPLMYKRNNIKYGLLATYKYMPIVSVEALYNSVEFHNKSSYALGAKLLLVGSVVDFLIKYEYIMNGVYKGTFQNNTETIQTKVNIEGSYISAGLRFKF